MSDLIVFAFETETGAQEMAEAVRELRKEKEITVVDAATVVRRADGKVKVKQAVNLVGAGALGGAFWGTLIGMLFMMPWLGLAVGAITGAIGGGVADVGIDDDFIKEVGNKVQPGNSALFLMVQDTDVDKLREDLGQFPAAVLQTSLAPEQEARLHDAFGADDDLAQPHASAA